MHLYDHSRYTVAHGVTALKLITEKSDNPNRYLYGDGYWAVDLCSLDGTPMRNPGAQPTVALDCEATSPR